MLGKVIQSPRCYSPKCSEVFEETPDQPNPNGPNTEKQRPRPRPAWTGLRVWPCGQNRQWALEVAAPDTTRFLRKGWKIKKFVCFFSGHCRTHPQMFSTNIYNKHSANTQLLLFLVPQDWVTPWALGKSQHKWSVSFQTSRTAQCITGNDSINYFRALNCLPRTPPTEPSSTLAQSHLWNANLQCYGCYGCVQRHPA